MGIEDPFRDKALELFLPDLLVLPLVVADRDGHVALLAGRPHRGMGCRQRLWMSISGSSSIRRLIGCPVVVDLHDVSPVGRRRERRPNTIFTTTPAAIRPTATPALRLPMTVPDMRRCFVCSVSIPAALLAGHA